MEKQVKQIYFPNLNAIRAIAAFMVIVFHIELIKSEFNLPNILEQVRMGGDLGVILFFVLSGFLITYLLLSENHVFGTISLKDFYLRRILRIWPLYLLIVTLCLFVFPHIPGLYEPLYSSNLARPYQIVLYYFFMANVLTGFMSHVNFARPTWSVSVEEQFYLLWPLLMKYSRNKVRTIFYVFVFYWAVKLMFIILGSHYVQGLLHFEAIKSLSIAWDYTPFDALSIGAICAYILFTDHYILKLIYKKQTQLILFLLAPVLIYAMHLNVIIRGLTTSIIVNNTVYAMIFGMIILNLASNKNVIVNIENKVTNFLGKISYGLYLYHWVIIVCVINLLKRFTFLGPEGSMAYNVFLYVLCVVLTILVAGISYYFFEYKFLKLKQRFSKLLSGDFAHIKNDH